jgi:hypothetical protein
MNTEIDNLHGVQVSFLDVSGLVSADRVLAG